MAQFRIRTLFGIVAIAAVVAAIYATHVRLASRVSHLEEQGISVFIYEGSLFQSYLLPNSQMADFTFHSVPENVNLDSLLSDFKGELDIWIKAESFDPDCLFDLSRLDNLKSIRIDNATDKVLLPISEIKSLTSIRLHGSDFTGTDLHILSSLKNLRTLDLSDTSLGDSSVKEISSIKSLRQLNFSRTQISDVGVNSLRGLNLTSLNLRRTDITVASLTTIATFSELSELNIWCRGISFSNVKKVECLSELPLQELFVSSVRLDSNETPTIAVWFPDCEIRWHTAIQLPEGFNEDFMDDSCPPTSPSDPFSGL